MKRFKIPAWDGATYYAKHWLVLENGGSARWTYVAKDGNTFVFIRIDDMVDACGSDAEYHFCASVRTVDPFAADVDTVAGALQYCGLEDEPPDMSTVVGQLALAQAMLDYGNASPLFEEQGLEVKDRWLDPDERHPGFRKLRAEARRFADGILADSEARDQMLDTKIVNAIGQTAREYAQGTGGFWDHLRKLQAMGDSATEKQRLFLKVFANSEQTLGAGPIPPDLRS
jgi:hypothetical protein